MRENIDIVANFKGFSEQIFNIGFLVIAYFMIKRANNRGKIYWLHTILITNKSTNLQELVKLMIYYKILNRIMRIIMVIMEEISRKSDYPNVLSAMAQENIHGKVIKRNRFYLILFLTCLCYLGETLDVCELCDGEGFIDFSTSTTNIRQLPNNINNNNWIDDERQ